ncbi:MAG TPA: hypothetical protein VG122_12120 [Gemmata sp.]|nr:hypothetical protein [Gemmata sp.]
MLIEAGQQVEPWTMHFGNSVAHYGQKVDTVAGDLFLVSPARQDRPLHLALTSVARGVGSTATLSDG